MFSQLFINSCTSCFSVLPCLKIRRDHHVSHRFSSWIICNTLYKRLPLVKSDHTNGKHRGGFINPYCTSLEEITRCFFMGFQWRRTIPRSLTQQTGHLSRPPVPAMHTGSYAIRVGNSCVKNRAPKGHQNHLNFGCGSAPETAEFKSTFSRVITCHLLSSSSSWEEDPVYLNRAYGNMSRKTQAWPKVLQQKGTSSLHFLQIKISPMSASWILSYSSWGPSLDLSAFFKMILLSLVDKPFSEFFSCGTTSEIYLFNSTVHTQNPKLFAQSPFSP